MVRVGLTWIEEPCEHRNYPSLLETVFRGNGIMWICTKCDARVFSNGAEGYILCLPYPVSLTYPSDVTGPNEAQARELSELDQPNLSRERKDALIEEIHARRRLILG